MIDAIKDLINTTTLTGWAANVFDVILVTVLFFGIIKLIRDSKSIQLAKGVVLLTILFVITTALNLQTSSYLFSLIFDNIFIILCVIFAPEIRKAIEGIGKGTVLKKGLLSVFSKNDFQKREETIKCINEICSACEELSRTKTGALIAFERDINLGEIIETGTVVNAQISEEIINNIFFPKAALHDGGMIIRDNLIAAAGCIFPLSNDQSIKSSFGTRHRAAIGMSEQSDAIVVVVSEETGNVSMARNGILAHNVNIVELKETLIDKFVNKINEEDNDGEKV